MSNYNSILQSNNTDLQAILDAILALNLVDAVKLITFTVFTTEYQAEEGMTWAQWVESNYNTDGFTSDGGVIKDNYGCNILAGSEYVTPSDVIEHDYNYDAEL